MKPVNTKLPVRFIDDRCKTDDVLFLNKILFEDENVCLCLILEKDWTEDYYVLFSKDDGTVLTTNLEFWYAENYEVS